MPLAGHPDDCECCVKIAFTPGARGRKRTGEEADLATFLPQQPPPEDEDDEEDGQPEWMEEEEEEVEEAALLNAHLFQAFDAHVAKLDAARLKRIEALSFKSALEDDGEGEVNEDASLDEIEGLGVWQPGDEFQGDVNYRTLQKLLTRVDQRGFERSAQQLEFHVAFMKAAARVIYRGSWETERPAIMKKHGWEKSNSEVLISTPRRFGKTFSIAIFCACLSLAFGLEVVVFSPARRASRKLLERIVEFVRLAGGEKRICEYNQEACRLNAFDGRKSLIRSFPSKVGVRAAATRTGLGWWSGGGRRVAASGEMADDELGAEAGRLRVERVQEGRALGVDGLHDPHALVHDGDLVKVRALGHDGNVRLVDAEGQADAHDELQAGDGFALVPEAERDRLGRLGGRVVATVRCSAHARGDAAVLEGDEGRLERKQREKEDNHADCNNAKRAPAAALPWRQRRRRVLRKVDAHLVVVVLLELGRSGLHGSLVGTEPAHQMHTH